MGRTAMTHAVYYNFQKDCYSMRNTKTGLVDRHVDEVALKDVVFHVNESGRQRVIEEQRKNVHAWLRGDEIEAPEDTPDEEIHYDPYVTEHFQDENGEPVYSADVAVLNEEGVYADV